jgi:hypothetical protein
MLYICLKCLVRFSIGTTNSARKGRLIKRAKILHKHSLFPTTDIAFLIYRSKFVVKCLEIQYMFQVQVTLSMLFLLYPPHNPLQSFTPYLPYLPYLVYNYQFSTSLHVIIFSSILINTFSLTVVFLHFHKSQLPFLTLCIQIYEPSAATIFTTCKSSLTKAVPS